MNLGLGGYKIAQTPFGVTDTPFPFFKPFEAKLLTPDRVLADSKMPSLIGSAILAGAEECSISESLGASSIIKVSILRISAV